MPITGANLPPKKVCFQWGLQTLNSFFSFSSGWCDQISTQIWWSQRSSHFNNVLSIWSATDHSSWWQGYGNCHQRTRVAITIGWNATAILWSGGSWFDKYSGRLLVAFSLSTYIIKGGCGAKVAVVRPLWKKLPCIVYPHVALWYRLLNLVQPANE